MNQHAQTTPPRAVFSIHYHREDERGMMRFAGPDLVAVREYFERHFSPLGYCLDNIENFSLRA